MVIAASMKTKFRVAPLPGGHTNRGSFVVTEAASILKTSTKSIRKISPRIVKRPGLLAVNIRGLNSPLFFRKKK